MSLPLCAWSIWLLRTVVPDYKTTRLPCLCCWPVQVPFAACLERLAAAEVLDDYYSAALGRRASATKQTRFASFPPYLVVALKVRLEPKP